MGATADQAKPVARRTSRAVALRDGAATAERTRQQIEETRLHISSTIVELEAEVRQTLDWRARVRARPWLYAGLAMGVGFLIAGGPGHLLGHVVKRRPAEPVPVLLPDGTLALPPPRRDTFAQRLAFRGIDAAATTAAAIVVNAILREMQGGGRR